MNGFAEIIALFVIICQVICKPFAGESFWEMVLFSVKTIQNESMRFV